MAVRSNRPRRSGGAARVVKGTKRLGRTLSTGTRLAGPSGATLKRSRSGWYEPFTNPPKKTIITGTRKRR